MCRGIGRGIHQEFSRRTVGALASAAIIRVRARWAHLQVLICAGAHLEKLLAPCNRQMHRAKRRRFRHRLETFQQDNLSTSWLQGFRQMCHWDLRIIGKLYCISGSLTAVKSHRCCTSRGWSGRQRQRASPNLQLARESYSARLRNHRHRA